MITIADLEYTKLKKSLRQEQLSHGLRIFSSGRLRVQPFYGRLTT